MQLPRCWWTTLHCCNGRARAAAPGGLFRGSAAMRCHWAAPSGRWPRCPAGDSSMRRCADLQHTGIARVRTGGDPSPAEHSRILDVLLAKRRYQNQTLEISLLYAARLGVCLPAGAFWSALHLPPQQASSLWSARYQGPLRQECCSVHLQRLKVLSRLSNRLARRV